MWFMDLGCQGKLSNQKLESGDHRLSQGAPVRLESEVPSCKPHTQASPLPSNEPVHHISVKQGRKLVWEFREQVLTPFPDDTSKHLISRWGKGNGESRVLKGTISQSCKFAKANTAVCNGYVVQTYR
jgi:hypothetical protein